MLTIRCIHVQRLNIDKSILEKKTNIFQAML